MRSARNDLLVRLALPAISPRELRDCEGEADSRNQQVGNDVTHERKADEAAQRCPKCCFREEAAERHSAQKTEGGRRAEEESARAANHGGIEVGFAIEEHPTWPGEYEVEHQRDEGAGRGTGENAAGRHAQDDARDAEEARHGGEPRH